MSLMHRSPPAERDRNRELCVRAQHDDIDRLIRLMLRERVRIIVDIPNVLSVERDDDIVFLETRMFGGGVLGHFGYLDSVAFIGIIRDAANIDTKGSRSAYGVIRYFCINRPRRIGIDRHCDLFDEFRDLSRTDRVDLVARIGCTMLIMMEPRKEEEHRNSCVVKLLMIARAAARLLQMQIELARHRLALQQRAPLRR